MENQNPVQTQTTEATSQKNNNSVWPILNVITLLIALAGFSFLYYQDLQLQKEIAGLKNSISAIQLASPSSTPIASTKVYTSEMDGFSITLPIDWVFHNDPLRGVWISYPVDNTSVQENPYANGDKGNIFTRTYTPDKNLQQDLASRNTFDSNRAENVMIGGEKGIFAPEMVNNGAIILVDHNGKRFEFSFGTIEPTLISTFKEIVLSVKFI